MTRLRFVTGKTPATTKILEETSLPLGFSLTPHAQTADLSKTKQDDHIEKVLSSFQNCQNVEEDKVENYTKFSQQKNFPVKESLVAKCTHCGAFINPYSPFLSEMSVLCCICRKVFEIDYETQREARFQATDNNLLPEDKHEYWNHIKRERSAINKCNEKLVELSVPVCSSKSIEKNGGVTSEDIYSIPASSCPPLLAILVDGTSYDAQYYDLIRKAIARLLETNSSHHFKETCMGIFVMTKGGGLSVFDLKSNGELKHVWVDISKFHKKMSNFPFIGRFFERFKTNSSTRVSESLSEILDIDRIFVPLKSKTSRLYIEKALDMLADSAISRSLEYCQNMKDSIREESNSYLGESIHAVLKFLGDVNAYHPGMKICMSDEDFVPSDIDKFMYAGGKIMCFLAGPPIELQPESAVSLKRYRGKVGMGGFGGCCTQIGKRFSSETADEEEILGGYKAYYRNGNETRVDQSMIGDNINGDILTLNQKSELNNPLEYNTALDIYFDNLSTRCGRAALALEIFAIVDDGTFAGLPFMRFLTEKTGGLGPLVISLSQHKCDSLNKTNYNTLAASILCKEVFTRSPWVRPTAFGALLRIRASEDLSIRRTSSRPSSSSYSSIFSRFITKGSSFNFLESPSLLFDSDLILIGCCENSLTLSFDMVITSSSGIINDVVHIDGRGDIMISPCIQTTFAYTDIVKHSESWVIVRRYKILSTKVDLSLDPEHIFDSLNIDVLSFVLFHDFLQVSRNFGNIESQFACQDWLISTLLCIYNSAKRCEKNIIKFYDQSGEQVFNNFNSSDRIIGKRHNTLSDTDILLAKGHHLLQSLHLIVFALLQTDALRPRSSYFCPSYDSTYAASVCLEKMPPELFMRAILPHITIWVVADDSKHLVEENVKLSISAIKSVIDDYISYEQNSNCTNSPYVPILIMDSPSHIIVQDCRTMHFSQSEITKECIQKSLRLPIEEAATKYRVAPTIYFDVNTKEDLFIGKKLLLSDALLEDLKFDTDDYSFLSWSIEIGEIVKRQLEY